MRMYIREKGESVRVEGDERPSSTCSLSMR